MEQTWRALLAWFIQDTQEKRRVAAALGINPSTLSRWVNGKMKPRIYHIKQLPALFPRYQKPLKLLLSLEYTDLFPPESKESAFIPGVFQDEVLRMLAFGDPELCTNTILSMGLNHLHIQINPSQHLDHHLFVYRCSPPSSKIQTIYEAFHLI